MPKIKVTAQQRANALEALNVMWPSVPEENVAHRLVYWRSDGDYSVAPTCGTLACFGGWTEWWPPFREQLGQDGLATWDTIAGLFGPASSQEINNLFAPRTGHPADTGFEGTDHALVSNRLRWLIKNSEVV